MVDNSKKFIELREKYKKIIFDKYSVNDTCDTIRIEFHYDIEGLSEFKTIWEIDKLSKDVNYDKNKLDILVFSLGMVELISYYKITCSENVEISCRFISKEQCLWWKKLFINGLSEFSYTNNIKLDENSFNFVVTGKKEYSQLKNNSQLFADRILIPIGGGKDSAVSLEMLKEKFDRYCYIVNPRKATLDTFKVSKIEDDKLIIANRKFDEKILKYNTEGFLNGHTPFSALIAFSSVVAAYVNGIENVALSNESSANESTVKNLSINHQYSKTYEFECDFREYEKKYIETGVNYFSLLRPLTEVGIAKIFAKHSEYHMIFKSCNVGSKNDTWCAKCAKCLFVYIILAPFIDNATLISIFGKNMLDDMSLKEIFDKLIGVSPEKPFECVGSRKEVNACLQMLCTKKAEKDFPVLLKYYKTLGIEKTVDLYELCKTYDVNNNLSAVCEKIIKEYMK